MPKITTGYSLDHLPKLSIKQYKLCGRDDLTTSKTACNYGGYREWFVCDCGRRVGVLYLVHEWRCRHCVGALYQSQLNQPIDRLNERINRIRERLGWVRGIAHGMGDKPKGMHQKTYQGLIAEYERLTSDLLGGYYEKFNLRRSD